MIPVHETRTGDRVHVCIDGEANREGAVLIPAVREKQDSEVICVFPNRALMVNDCRHGQRACRSWTRAV